MELQSAKFNSSFSFLLLRFFVASRDDLCLFPVLSLIKPRPNVYENVSCTHSRQPRGTPFHVHQTTFVAWLSWNHKMQTGVHKCAFYCKYHSQNVWL